MFKNRIFILLLFVVSYSITYAQQRARQNVQRVIVTSYYVLKDGDKTDKTEMYYQELYDSLGRLHTEVNWNYPDHRSHGYIWHTFEGKQKVKTEYFEYEKLKLIKEFYYTKDSLIEKEVIKKVDLVDTSIYLKLLYSYNKLRKPVQIDAKTAKGETAYTSKSVFDDKGTELSRTVKIKANIFPSDSIIKLISKPQYDSLGRITSCHTSITKANKTTTVRIYKYSYDKRSNIIGITTFDSKGQQLSREHRMFQENRNRLSMIKYFNSKDTLTLWLVKRYEIYRYKNRLKFEIDY